MKALLDNDFLWKVCAAGAFDHVLATLNLTRSDCYVLASLKAQLKRGTGKLCKKIGPAGVASLTSIVVGLATIPDDSAGPWLDRLAKVDGIDAGEALLFSYAAANDAVVLATGDKRAVRAIDSVADLAGALEGKVLILDHLLAHCCDKDGKEAAKERFRGLLSEDTATLVAFSSADPAGTFRGGCASLAPQSVYFVFDSGVVPHEEVGRDDPG